MKSIFKRMPKKLFAAVATVALVAGIASQALAGFGPNRPTRPWNEGLNGFDHVTFNSFTGVPNGIGDERNFLRGVQVGRDSAWSDPVNGVDHNAEVEMKIYIHNNASSTLNASGEGVAKNVKVRADLPTGLSQTQQVTSYISADNAQPKEIWDTLDMTGANNGFFELDYVEGSAKMFDHESDKTTAISDNLVNGGVTLPNQKGCFEYVREITFRVKVKMPSYATQKTARLKGESSDKWRKVVNAEIGDEVEYRVWFKNSGTSDLNSVKMVDNLPPYTTVVGNVEMDKGTRTITYGPEAVQNNGRQVNIDMGTFNPNDDAFVYITVKIDDAEELECGAHQINNTAYTTPQGLGALNDSASVNVIEEECEEPETPKYVCESVTVDKIGGRKVRVTVRASASNDAELKSATINYGDGTTPKLVNNVVNGEIVDEYTYASDSTYQVTAKAVLTDEAGDHEVSSDACADTVSFSTTPEVPGELPKTGAGSLIGLFTVVTFAAAAAHNLLSRRASL